MAALKPYVTAGVALVGASVISITPISPQVVERTSDRYVALTAAASNVCEADPAPDLCGDTASPEITATDTAVFGESSLLYIPGNLFNALLSLPAWQIQAMDRLADAMIGTGSWQVWGPTNVFGFDEWDPPKLKAFIDVLVPFQPFSSVLGEQLSVWAQANLPMHSGCAGTPGACPDPNLLLDSMFKVPLSQLYDGYQFPAAGEQGSTNPFDGSAVSWAGDYVELEPWGPFKNTWEWLTTPPKPVASVTLADFIRVPLKLAKSLFDAFNPFVQNSSIFNPKNGLLAVAAKALAPLFCKNCDLDNLYDNPWLYDNYDPQPPLTDEQTDGPEAPADGEGGAPSAAELFESTPEVAVDAFAGSEAAAVSTLRKKFQAAAPDEPVTEEPAPTSQGDPAEAPVDEVDSESIDEDSTDEDDTESVQSIKDKVETEKVDTEKSAAKDSAKTDDKDKSERPDRSDRSDRSERSERSRD